MDLDNIIGPSTAGLAQRIGKKYGTEENKYGLTVLKRNYVMPCSTNQF